MTTARNPSPTDPRKRNQTSAQGVHLVFSHNLKSSASKSTLRLNGDSLPIRLFLGREMFSHRKLQLLKRNRSRVLTNRLLPLADEASFLNLLHIERKRVERSGQHLVLLLVEFNGLLNHSSCRFAFDNFRQGLLLRIRETDYPGWYQQDAVFGIIFTELLIPGKNVTSTLRRKVGDVIASTFPAEASAQISVALHSFPEPWDATPGDDPADTSATPNNVAELVSQEQS